MGLVAAQCTQCGANIEVDNTKEAGFCTHCGMPFVTEKVINNYNTAHVNYNTQHVVKNIYGKEKTEAQEYIRNADAFIKMKEYERAEEQLELAIKTDPSDWRVWFAMVRLSTKNFTDTSFDAEDGYWEYREKAEVVIPPQELPELEKLCESYSNMLKQRNLRLNENERVEQQRREDERQTERQARQERFERLDRVFAAQEQKHKKIVKAGVTSIVCGCIAFVLGFVLIGLGGTALILIGGLMVALPLFAVPIGGIALIWSVVKLKEAATNRFIQRSVMLRDETYNEQTMQTRPTSPWD